MNRQKSSVFVYWIAREPFVVIHLFIFCCCCCWCSLKSTTISHSVSCVSRTHSIRILALPFYVQSVAMHAFTSFFFFHCFGFIRLFFSHFHIRVHRYRKIRHFRNGYGFYDENRRKKRVAWRFGGFNDNNFLKKKKINKFSGALDQKLHLFKASFMTKAVKPFQQYSSFRCRLFCIVFN